MLWYICLQVVIYVMVMILLHYLYNYLKNTFTIKRTKDLVGLHNEKYQEIINELQELKLKAPIGWLTEEQNSVDSRPVAGRRLRLNATQEKDEFDKDYLENSLTKLIETI